MSDSGLSRRAKVGVVGLGYIGLPTAAVVAGSGCEVLGLDVRPSVIDAVNRGEIHIEELGLDVAVKQAVSSGKLRASVEPETCDVWLIAVPTPFRSDKSPDISSVLAAARTIAAVLRPGDLIIIESTSPVGTTELVRDAVAEARPDLFNQDGQTDVLFAYCPERVLPGRIMEELLENDRCIGGLNQASTGAAKRFYEQFVRGECVPTDARTAEMVKLVENASRDVSIAFANELSLIADQLDVDVWQVIALANRHPRVSILQPGPGVGGHCIAVDPWFLVSSAPNAAKLIRTAREVNDGKPDFVLQQAANLLRKHPNSRLACLGLTFKPNTDDLRESPALNIAARLAKDFGERIVCVDPHVSELPPILQKTGAELLDWDDAVARCKLALVLVDHAEFYAKSKQPPFDDFYDSRGMWHSSERNGQVPTISVAKVNLRHGSNSEAQEEATFDPPLNRGNGTRAAGSALNPRTV